MASGGERARLAGLCGILSPVVAFSAIALAIALSPWFSWRKNALSDLGALKSPVWPIFNGGLIIASILALFFAYELLAHLEGRLGRAGAALLLVGSLSLALIGVFPEDVRPVHFIVSAAFFILAPLGLVVIGASRLLGPEKGLRPLGALTLVLGVASGLTWAFWALLRPALGIAVPETIAAALVSAALIVLGLRVARSEPV